MANIVIILLLIALICNLVAKGEKTLYTNNELLPLSPFDNNDPGICELMVQPQGYACEEHQVTTQDGYILSLQRMPAGRSGNKANKPAVLLQHGIITDAVLWLLNSPDKSLAFILADNGFDVWLTSTRGTKYSRGHTLSHTDQELDYWDWTFDELISYDLPDTVSYVFNQTGGAKLHYVGHSLGALTLLAGLSQDSTQQQLENMLRSAALLSPIAHLNQITSPFLTFGAHIIIVQQLYWLALREFIPNGGIVDHLINSICLQLQLNCGDLLAILTGPNCCLNTSRTAILLQHEPQPTSTKNIVHLAQMVTRGTIAKFDYGVTGNLLHYKQVSPPNYNMASIPNEFPLFLGHGGKDSLSDLQDVQNLLNDLQGHDTKKLNNLLIEEYAHADFVLGDNAKQIVYDPMMAFLDAN